MYCMNSNSILYVILYAVRYLYTLFERWYSDTTTIMIALTKICTNETEKYLKTYMSPT